MAADVQPSSTVVAQEGLAALWVEQLVRVGVQEWAKWLGRLQLGPLCLHTHKEDG